jgi:sugar/nucleoside kinase (ribokinase family)
LHHKSYFALNLSATFLIDKYQREFNELIPKCDFVFGNEDEFMHLAKTLDLVKPEEVQDSEQCFFGICQKLHDKYH